MTRRFTRETHKRVLENSKKQQFEVELTECTDNELGTIGLYARNDTLGCSKTTTFCKQQGVDHFEHCSRWLAEHGMRLVSID